VNEGLEKFVDLENRIYRIIEVHKATRVQKEALEKECQKVKHQLELALQDIQRLKDEVREAEEDRQLVRQKVEELLARLDELGMGGVLDGPYS
jgi:predicted nuclease with TOPRIM domain